MNKEGRLYGIVHAEITRALKKFKGNKTKTSAYLGITRRGLQLKLQEYKQTEDILKATEEMLNT
jgi:DNA-binding NtrC family response regulator